MPHCAMCHRPMKAVSHDGLGPVCRRRAKPPAAIERDLFSPPYDIAAACEAARRVVAVAVELAAQETQGAISLLFREARVRALVRAV